jgi:general nucleoside transport system permease protein
VSGADLVEAVPVITTDSGAPHGFDDMAPQTRGNRAADRWSALAPRVRGAARFMAAVAAAFAIFGIFMAIKGANPVSAYHDMFKSTLFDGGARGDILIKASPLILAGLAVAVPARAGLINVGGEGQLVIGGLAAIGVSLALDGSVSGPLSLVLMALAAAVAGAAWSSVAAGLRLSLGISESVTTLLMNYIALDLMYFLIYDRWKDPTGTGQPATRPLSSAEHLPIIGDGRVHLGILIAVVAAVVMGLVLKGTSWGFRLSVVGGNMEAARRAGLRVGVLLFSAMAVGGALAGLGGFVQLAGAEFKIRPGFLATYGYVGFLASWLARHKPLPVAVGALALAAIALSGTSLQIDSQLPAASVNVLMALTLLVVFGFGRARKVAS